MLRIHEPTRRVAMVLTGLTALALSGRQVSAAETGAKAAGSAPKQRKIVPGIEKSIPVVRKPEETADEHPVIELVKTPDLEWTPRTTSPTETLFNKASNTYFRRGIWQLQFSFRPLRMIRLDLPQANGKMQQKVIWYMVYRVSNPGRHYTPVAAKENATPLPKGLHTIAVGDSAEQMLSNSGHFRFIPIFKLKSHDLTPNKEWIDQIVPLAKEAIFRREQPPCTLETFYNTVKVAGEIKKPLLANAGDSVWGFVTWVGGDPVRPAPDEIDPKIDTFSINIWGLTNAYQWQDTPDAYKPGDPPGTGRTMKQKVLEINFSSPGDEYLLREEEIKLGQEGKVDWEWIYR